MSIYCLYQEDEECGDTGCGMKMRYFEYKFSLQIYLRMFFSATCTLMHRFDSKIQDLSPPLKDSVEERTMTRTCSSTMMSENVHQLQCLPKMNDEVNYDLQMQ